MTYLTKLTPLALSVALLTACGSANDNAASTPEQHAHQHPHQHHDIGRLAISEMDNTNLHIVNITGEQEVAKFALNYQASALYASPEYRYALALSRTANHVQIIDGGLFKEAHEDHFHERAETPKLLTTWQQTKPTHYRQVGTRATVFFDGDGGSNAQVYDFSDSDIQNPRILEASNNMHGVAEPLGDYLLSTHRVAGQTAILPDTVKAYKFDNTSKQYSELATFASQCPGLHGGVTAKSGSAFGCTTGVLLVTHNGDKFSATLIENPQDLPARGGSKDKPARIGGFDGSQKSDLVAAWAAGHLYALDTHNKTLKYIDWANGDTTAKRSSSVLDDAGKYLMVLDTTGNIHLLDATANFKYISKIKVLDKMPALKGHASVSISPNPRNDDVYIVNSENKRIEVLNLATKKLEKPINLAYKPAKAVWLGFVGETQDHH